MKIFLEITCVGGMYYLTHKNWYDWNKPGNWSDVGIKVGSRTDVWRELKWFLENQNPAHIFGKEHIIDLYNQWNREEKLKKLGI